MPDFIKKPTLLSAWVAVGLWVLAYGLLKVFSLDGLDIDGAEQVYFAQSWQMGYGTRQPPLYTWLLLWLKPQQAAWAGVLEFSRYVCLLVWLAGVQALAKVCGADRSVQARVILAHLGLLLVMWRVHDSLTHTVLAAGVSVWASVVLIKALHKPAYWLLVGGLAAVACLSKLNAALWCVSSLLSAWIVILTMPSNRPSQEPAARDHLIWMSLGLMVFVVAIAPYAHWWLTQPSGSVALARRIVISDDHQPLWRPLTRVLAGSLEYLLLTPLLLFALTSRIRSNTGRTGAAASIGSRWLLWQTGVGLVILSLVLVAMKASHFTPRWLWPVVPGLTVWMCVRSFQSLDVQADGGSPAWRARASVLVWCLVLVSIGMAAVRLSVPRANAQRCTNCWTDRPAQLMSSDLHARYGQQALRIITGDDHLAGILSQVDERDSTWTASSVDLPPPADFVHDRSPCVASWVSMDNPSELPDGLRHLVGDAWGAPVAQASWPMRLAAHRRIWLSSMALPVGVCDKARQ
ncbi:MAG: hypothetical protein EPO09_01560 [Aquabacterium sp.]|uniref:hypothetical protein n=1 Tax=Aquabacterium sp. TaxID=1872578 RepID=UPI0012159295|nr:hypothetical protein [Aquabacterium sp.]TAK99156.1 MAG: hypothetical protein EPO09_01560 [Aquabacterium sp.]